MKLTCVKCGRAIIASSVTLPMKPCECGALAWWLDAHIYSEPFPPKLTVLPKARRSLNEDNSA